MTGELKKLEARVAELERLDREAATHVESLICMRTHFTGEYPYVGWRGLGLALKEHLDTQAAEIAALREAVKPFSDFGAKVSDWVPDTATFANATFTYGDLRRAAAAYGRET